MKKIFTLAVFLSAITVFLSSCYRDNIPNNNNNNNENYWLSQEQAEVVYSDSYCNYYVVESYYGFAVIRSYGSYKPYEGSIVYGNFSSRGTRDFYNRSSSRVFTGAVTDYWLSYAAAQNALDYYCPVYGKGEVSKREFKKSTLFPAK